MNQEEEKGHSFHHFKKRGSEEYLRIPNFDMLKWVSRIYQGSSMGLDASLWPQLPRYGSNNRGVSEFKLEPRTADWRSRLFNTTSRSSSRIRFVGLIHTVPEEDRSGQNHSSWRRRMTRDVKMLNLCQQQGTASAGSKAQASEVLQRRERNWQETDMGFYILLESKRTEIFLS